MSQRPVVRALKICQQIIIEEGTHHYTLVNCLSRLIYDSFPATASFVVHAVLGDGFGPLPVQVVIVRVADDVEVYTYWTLAKNRVPDSCKSPRFRPASA